MSIINLMCDSEDDSDEEVEIIGVRTIGKSPFLEKVIIKSEVVIEDICGDVTIKREAVIEDICGDDMSEACDLEVSILGLDLTSSKTLKTVTAGLAQTFRFDEAECIDLVRFDEHGKGSVKGSHLLKLLVSRCSAAAVQTADKNEKICNTKMANFLLRPEGQVKILPYQLSSQFRSIYFILN